jgi:hypothetical protein
VSDRSESANVLFEIGLAAGLGKPIFIVATFSADLPVALQSYPHFVGPMDDSTALSFHLRLFTQRLDGGPLSASTRTAKSRKQVDSLAPVSLSDIRRELGALDSHQGSELERLVGEALSRAGIEITLELRQQSQEEHYRPDLVAWIPSVPPDIGNPMAIEIKGYSFSGQRRLEAIERLGEYLRRARLRAGVLVLDQLDSPPEAGIHSIHSQRNGGHCSFGREAVDQ